jgi:hypothetical protein
MPGPVLARAKPARMVMKLKLWQEKFISKSMTLLSGVLLVPFSCCAPTLTPPAYASANNYVDPIDRPGSWSYTPVPDADGYDANITHIRVNPKGVMRASNGTDHPTFTLRFQVRVQ